MLIKLINYYKYKMLIIKYNDTNNELVLFKNIKLYTTKLHMYFPNNLQIVLLDFLVCNIFQLN